MFGLKKDKGIALILVLLVGLILIVIIFSAFAVGSRNILFMANYRDKTQAIYAAEAGIREAIYKLEDNIDYSQNFEGAIIEGKALYKVEISNDLRGSTGIATIESTGMIGKIEGENYRTKRKLKVTVQIAPGAFNSLSADGEISLNGLVVIDGIQSIKNPKEIPGNIHTNYSGYTSSSGVSNIYSRLGENYAITYDKNLGTPKVNITGVASAYGKVNPELIPEETHRKDNSPAIQIASFNKDSVLPEVFDKTYTSGVYNSIIVNDNVKVTGDIVINGDLKLERGKVIYVNNGNLVVNGAIYGKGSVVVDQKTVFRGYSKIISDSENGIAIYSEGDITVAHPQAVIYNASQGIESIQFNADQNNIADFFANMPKNALSKISSRLPDDAPRDGDFFNWYKNAATQEWKETLPKNVKEWLDESKGITAELTDYLK